MNRLPFYIWTLLVLATPTLSYAYVGMPLAKLKEKGVILSALPGFHNQSVNLSYTAPGGIQLMISLDGNIPTESQSFSRPITLSQTTPVTIALAENGKRNDTLYCGTYLIGFSSVLPVTTLILPPAGLFDPASGIYVGGLRPPLQRWGNCWGSTERQAFFELYDKGGKALSQGVGLRIFGGMTRQNAEKSLRVIAREKYGKGKFKYRVFPTKQADEFNSLVLRTSGNDWMRTRFQDMMISSLAKDLNVDYMAYQPSVLFVNGEYWGIHNIREKINVSFLESNHEADPKQTNLIQGVSAGAVHGSISGYKELFQFLSAHSPYEPGFVDSVEKRMDVDNYFKYLSLQIHIHNVDSRGNVRYWQAKNLDNRFRWIYYDGDLGFGGVRGDYLKERLSPVATAWHNPPPTTFLLRNLTANEIFRDRFITQYCTLLSTWLHADTIASRVNYFKSWLEPEIERHLQRKDFTQTKSNWLSHVKQLINYAAIRMPLAYEHLKSNFNLGDKFQLTLTSPLPVDKMRYVIERIPLPSLPYKGVFFKDARVNVHIDYLHPRYRFVSWENGSTDPNRLIYKPADSMVNLNVRLEETPASSLRGAIWINSIGHGKKDQPTFIEINGWNKRMDSVWLIDSRKICTIPFIGTSLPIVLVEDSIAFRKQFPGKQVSLLQFDKLPIKQMGQTLYLTEPSGAWIDSVNLLTWDSTNRKKPYWVRSDDGKLVLSKTAPSFTLATRTWFKHPAVLITLAVLTITGLVYLVRKKRAKVNAIPPTLILILALFSFIRSNAQPENSGPEKFRQVDVELLRQSALIFNGPNRIQYQSSFYRTFQPIDKPLMWVAPFRSVAISKENWCNSYTVEAFKELPADNFRTRHMKFSERAARCWIAGTKKDFFLIDTIKKLYLARVEHENGMESWYYPIVNPVQTADERTPGSVLGATGGFYYWQLRYRSCSILASALIRSDGTPDPKGIVIENLCPTISDPEARVKNFSKALFEKISEQGLNTDWEKALEEELKKQ
ncbi:MAG: CotH kinase family protein [Bacteroidota bacterium]